MRYYKKQELVAIQELLGRRIEDYYNSKFLAPVAEILMIHRVRQRDIYNLPYFEDMNIPPMELQNKLLRILEMGGEFITLDDLKENLLYGDLKSDKKKFVITIDDGYKETFDTLYPILKKFNLPFTLYVSSSFPNKEIALWWNYLNDLIISKDYLELAYFGPMKIITLEQKQHAYIKFSREILKLGDQINSQFEMLFNVDYLSIVDRYKNQLLDWQDLKVMNMDSLCTIGAHTNKHFGLRYSDIDSIKNDILKNVYDLNDHLGVIPKHFAFPYGTYFSIGKREFELVKSMGFETAVNTYSAEVYSRDKNNLFSLPRTVLRYG
jgi:peptidoglycan/xylan/chitin deacetylase (PgdA/CDA1 family)